MTGNHENHKLTVTYYEEKIEVYTFEGGRIIDQQGDDYPTPVPKLDIDCLTCGHTTTFDINESTPRWVSKLYDQILNPGLEEKEGATL